MNPDVKEIRKRNPNINCEFCHRSEVKSLEWGPLYHLDDVYVHYFCLLFSAGLSQNGSDNEGILGFLLVDIRKELKRGKKLRCKFCRRTGATIGCSTKSCKTSYHYPCGFENNSNFQFIGNFASYCEKHREKLDKPYAGSVIKCPICYELVDEKYPLCPPCCSRRIFHKVCMMKMAKNHAAHFFKCPLCSVTNTFSVAMRRAGIYLPDQDATWELEPNAYNEHKRVYSRCDAEVCSCPKGRQFSSSSDCESYKIVRCGACAASAVHKKCGNLTNLKWRCAICTDILSDKQRSKNMESSRIQRRRYDNSDDDDANDIDDGQLQRRLRNKADIVQLESESNSNNEAIPQGKPRNHSNVQGFEMNDDEIDAQKTHGSNSDRDRDIHCADDDDDEEEEDFFISSKTRAYEQLKLGTGKIQHAYSDVGGAHESKGKNSKRKRKACNESHRADATRINHIPRIFKTFTKSQQHSNKSFTLNEDSDSDLEILSEKLVKPPPMPSNVWKKAVKSHSVINKPTANISEGGGHSIQNDIEIVEMKQSPLPVLAFSNFRTSSMIVNRMQNAGRQHKRLGLSESSPMQGPNNAVIAVDSGVNSDEEGSSFSQGKTRVTSGHQKRPKLN